MCIAFSVGVSTLLSTYLQLIDAPMGSAKWTGALLLSFFPWLAMAVAGIALALANLRLEPLVFNAKQFHEQLSVVGRSAGHFGGVPLKIFDSELALVFTGKSDGRQTIFTSSGLRKQLSASELEVVLTHELAHVRFRHNELKALARFIQTLTPWMRVSNALVQEVENLCEIAANKYAARRFGAEEVARVSQIVLGQ